MIEGLDGSGIVMGHVLAGLPSVVAVARASGYPGPNQLDRWMTQHGLELNGAGRPLVRRFLNRTRWIRTLGFVVGFTVLPLGWLWWTRAAHRMNEWPFWIGLVCSYVAAVVIAQLVRPRPEAGVVTSGRTRSRRLYTPLFARRDPVVIGLAFAVLLVWAAATSRLDQHVLVLALAAGLGWAMTFGLQRFALVGPQSASSVEVLHADDLLRATSSINATAFGYGISLVCLGRSVTHVGENLAAQLAGMVAVCGGLAFAYGLLRLDTRCKMPRPEPERVSCPARG